MTAPRYRRARELAGLTLAQAARLLGTGACDLSNMEINAADPILRATPEMERLMVDVYGCSLAWLQGAEPEVPESTREMLRDADLNPTERDDLLELLGSIGGRK